MFFPKNLNSAILIKKDSLVFYHNGQVDLLEFPDGILSDGDIINLQEYTKLVENLFNEYNFKNQKIILFICEELLFRKTLPITDIKSLDERMLDFISIVPLESEKLIKKAIFTSDNIELFAANRRLFENIIDILQKHILEVLAVIPLPVYSADEDLNEGLIRKVYQNKDLLKKANFLSGNTGNSSGISKQILILMGFLIVIIFILAALLANLYFIHPKTTLKEVKQTKLNQVNVSSPESSEAASTNPATSSAFLTKKEIRVNVLNGTGIAGQAAKIENLLVELGLLEIETGNAEDGNLDETVVVFSSSISNEIREEIISILKDNFDDVVTQEDAVMEDFDILITTGKTKTISQ